LDDYRKSLLPLAKEFRQAHLVRGETLVREEDKWFVDGVHPNDAGFELYAKNLLPRLKRALA
jgi:lysophospholipase L1-like esterase